MWSDAGERLYDHLDDMVLQGWLDVLGAME